MTDTNLSPADLAWIQRLPSSGDLTYEDVQIVRGLRRGLDRPGGDAAARRKDLRLLDSMLVHADEIEARHDAPRQAEVRLRQIEEHLRALNGNSAGIASRRLAEASTRAQADQIEAQAMAEAIRRTTGWGSHDREQELGRVRASIAKMRKAMPEVIEEVAYEHQISMERTRDERITALRNERQELQRVVAS